MARTWLAVLVASSLVGGCTRTGGAATAIVGMLAVGGGIALVATDDPCPDDSCRFGTDQGWGGRLLIVSGAVMMVAGVIALAVAPAAHDAAPAPAMAPYPVPPMIVDPNKRDTEQDRLATQASLAARRRDCAATNVAMKRLVQIDVALYDHLRADDGPIATCMLNPPGAR